MAWYTRETGNVKGSPDYSVPFGINSLGLVNAYAKDVADLPEWLQRVWAGFNISPEGKVSEELFSAQARGVPARTKAPESFLPVGVEVLMSHSEIVLEQLFFGRMLQMRSCVVIDLGR